MESASCVLKWVICAVFCGFLFYIEKKKNHSLVVDKKHLQPIKLFLTVVLACKCLVTPVCTQPVMLVCVVMLVELVGVFKKFVEAKFFFANV